MSMFQKPTRKMSSACNLDILRATNSGNTPQTGEIQNLAQELPEIIFPPAFPGFQQNNPFPLHPFFNPNNSQQGSQTNFEANQSSNSLASPLQIPQFNPALQQGNETENGKPLLNLLQLGQRAPLPLPLSLPPPPPNALIQQFLLKQAILHQQSLKQQGSQQQDLNGLNISTMQQQPYYQQQQLQQSQQQASQIANQLQHQQLAQNFQQQQMILQLGILNSPSLIQQLLQTISDPLENAKFSTILLKLSQQAAIAGGNQTLMQSQQSQIAPLTLSSNSSKLSAGSSGAGGLSATTLSTSNQNIQQKLINQQKQKDELTNMLEFLVDKMHQIDTDQIFEKKKELKYLNNEDTSIFENIVHKYQFSKKTKEEMIKYILRKCFKFLKSGIKQQEIGGQKDVEVAFSRKYFGGETESSQTLMIQNQFNAGSSNNAILGKRGRDSDDSDEIPEEDQYKVKEEQVDNQGIDQKIGSSGTSSNRILPPPSTSNLEIGDGIEKVMPFKQGSKIKTMNIQFLKMIFRSELFAKDYQLYLEQFEELAEKENQKKIQKCVKNLQDFIEKGQINKVKSYKRLPWLKIWLKETYELAKTLSTYAEEDGQREETDGIASQTELKKKQKLSELSSSQRLAYLKTNDGGDNGYNQSNQEQQLDSEKHKKAEIHESTKITEENNQITEEFEELNQQERLVKREENEYLSTSCLLKDSDLNQLSQRQQTDQAGQQSKQDEGQQQQQQGNVNTPV